MYFIDIITIEQLNFDTIMTVDSDTEMGIP